MLDVNITIGFFKAVKTYEQSITTKTPDVIPKYFKKEELERFLSMPAKRTLGTISLGIPCCLNYMPLQVCDVQN